MYIYDIYDTDANYKQYRTTYFTTHISHPFSLICVIPTNVIDIQKFKYMMKIIRHSKYRSTCYNYQSSVNSRRRTKALCLILESLEIL